MKRFIFAPISYRSKVSKGLTNLIQTKFELDLLTLC